MRRPRPDALVLPASVKQGDRLADRVDSIVTAAERLLEVDRSVGELAWARSQKDGNLFVTRQPRGTLKFPHDHPRSGEPRYTWETGDDEIQRGWLVAGADDNAA